MDRPKARVLAVGCVLAMGLSATGCQNVPSRRVPPEPPYGGGWSGQPGSSASPVVTSPEVGFSAAASPSTTPSFAPPDQYGGMPLATSPGISDPGLTTGSGGVR